MKISSKILILLLVLNVAALCVAGQQPVQNDEDLNFGYSKNPPAKSSKGTAEITPAKSTPEIAKVPGNGQSDESSKENPPKYESVARMTRDIAIEESIKNLRPSEIYKVGIGDVLFVSIQDSKSNYYTVLSDGSIDYPLAGGLVSVSGLTVNGIEALLRSKVQLYEDPDVAVRVREYASHQVDIVGMAEKTGKLFLQREAMPLYVIRAQSLAESAADVVVIKREGSEEIVVPMGSAEFDAALVYTGDVVEFASSAIRAAKNGFVYVGGSVGNVGRIGFLEGMTLTQAIIAAGGLTDEKAKKATIRRKNSAGYLESNTYKIADIKKGKSIDPVLEAGDLIEVDS